MPIYEYQCTNCDHKFDVLQKMNDEPVTECPECHKNKAVRLVSAACFQLKGTGWYATDFKDNGKPKKPNETQSDTAKPASDAKVETAKTETSTPAAKSKGESD